MCSLFRSFGTAVNNLRKITTLVLCVCFVLAGTSMPSASAWADQTDRDFRETQRTNLRVLEALEKARAERSVRNFRRARSFGERALRLLPDSKAAKAFLEHLDAEEKQWEEYQEKQRRMADREKEEERARKEALREQEREERARKQAEREAQREAEREARERERAARLEELRREREPVREPEVIPEDEVDVVRPDVPRKPVSYRDDPDVDIAIREKRSIVVDGERVEYFQEEGRIVAEGDVLVRYGDTTLSCDRIEIDTGARIALCKGNVRIEDPAGVLEGESIRYDLAQELGEIVSPEVRAFPWFGRAEETSKVGPNEYLLRDGYITTCDEDEPHYHIKASEIRIFPDDKVIARNVTYYIGKVPVLWVPYYYHPIVQTKAKVQFIPGVTSDWGYFMLSSWRFHIKGNTKVDGILDYRTKKGFAYGANLYYDVDDTGIEGLGRGLLRAYFIDQHGFGTYSPSEYREEGTEQKWRSRLQWKHRIDFDDRTVGMMEWNKVSDKYVLKDYFYNEFEENNPIPPNYASIITSTPNYSFSLEAKARLDDHFTVTQKLPEARLEVFNQRLWDTPFYYRSSSSATYFEKLYASHSSPDEKVARADTYQRFSYAAGLGPLSIVPYGTLQGTAYSRGKDRDDPVARGTFGGGVETSARFHRVFDLSTDRLGLEINGLRHIVRPSAHYYYTYKPNISKGHFYQLDAIDALEHRNGIEVSLANKLQTRIRDPKHTYSMDLVRSVITGNYSFREKEEGPRLTMLTSELEVRPYRWLYFDNRLEIETENFSLKTNRIEAVLRPWKSFQTALGYRYEKRPKRSRSHLTFDARWVINPKWTVGLYERFDLEAQKIDEQQITITRDLHCWEVDLAYNVKGSNIFKDDYTFWLAFRLKAFPDLPLGLSRAYNKTPPGSLGSPATPSMTTDF